MNDKNEKIGSDADGSVVEKTKKRKRDIKLEIKKGGKKVLEKPGAKVKV